MNGYKNEKLEEEEKVKKTGEKYLPIGSVVLLKGGTKRLMITGFCAVQEKEEKVWDYSGCMYPEGILSSAQTALFDHNQIETVYFYGLVDEEEQSFKKELKKILKENE